MKGLKVNTDKYPGALMYTEFDNKGDLDRMAYANVGVDGVAGEQTRAAIRHFQKHYNLPENGEPSEAVLKKLKEIGAL